MQQINDGQCGLCKHFGEEHPTEQALLQIRRDKQASESFVDDCGHPTHAKLNLKVTVVSGCDAFEMAEAA